MSTCRNCGARLEPGAAFCTDCGTTVNSGNDGNAGYTPFPSPIDEGRTRQLVRPPRRRLAYLVVKSGTDPGTSVQLSEATYVGAESNGHGLVLSDRYVSGRHAMVRLEDDVFVYHDLASRNGSWLVGRNGQRTRIGAPLSLRHGDTIEVGRTRLVYMEAGR